MLRKRAINALNLTALPKTIKFCWRRKSPHDKMSNHCLTSLNSEFEFLLRLFKQFECFIFYWQLLGGWNTPHIWILIKLCWPALTILMLEQSHNSYNYSNAYGHDSEMHRTQ